MGLCFIWHGMKDLHSAPATVAWVADKAARESGPVAYMGI